MCNKITFDTEAKAIKFAKRAASAIFGGRRQRAYYCKHCKGFHLTTQSKNKGKRV